MVRLVVDASAGVELLLDTSRGRRIEQQLPSGAEWWVPEHYYVEVANTLRRADLRGTVPAARIEQAIRRLHTSTIRRAQVAPLVPDAWERRKALTIADAL
ncbi:MAG TPA: type II toxin-antitoxin system VapC family toxin [Ilumatobacter sp.]|nr:type II toxin-antitoxin system VapC family toxin [Ilumatobacter sp.]